MTIRVTIKQDLHVVKKIRIAVDLQDLRRGERFELMKVHPLVQHRIAHERSKTARPESLDGVFIRAHQMNGRSLTLELRDEDVRLLSIKKDVDRYASVVSAQALHAAEKLLVIIRHLCRPAGRE